MSIENQKFTEKKETETNPENSLQGIFERTINNLSDLAAQVGKFFGGNSQLDNSKKTNTFQEFLTKITGFLNGVNIEKGVTVEKPEDIEKIKSAFRPIIDLNETAIEFKVGDFIIYNKALGTVDFYPADKNYKTGHTITPNGIVPITNRTAPIPDAKKENEEFEKSFDGKI